jgi:hypothetical protein
MSFRMATPRHTKSRSITVRKGIPKDVRAEYQRLYGPGWEAKLTVPAGTPANGTSGTSDATRRTPALRRIGTTSGSH